MNRPDIPKTTTPTCRRVLRAMRMGVALLAIAPAAGPALAVDGGALYAEACAACHGRRGEETPRGRSRRLDTLSATAVRDYLTAARAVETPARPYQRLKQGLSEAEIEALVDHIGQFAGH